MAACSEDDDDVQQCIGFLDNILDLYDDDDDDDYANAMLFRSSHLPPGDATAPNIPYTSFAQIAGRNLEIRKSNAAGA